MRTAASGRETSVATSLTRARDANARQRAAFQRFKRDVVTSQEFSGRSSVGTTGRASTTTRAAPKGTNTFIESFFDLADVVAGGRDNAGFSELATRIGDDVYIQVNAWRLYLKDMHFADGLAKVFAVKIADNGNKYDDKIVDEVLGVVRVPLGGGKSDSPLGDLCPSSSVSELKNILRDYVDDRL